VFARACFSNFFIIFRLKNPSTTGLEFECFFYILVGI